MAETAAERDDGLPVVARKAPTNLGLYAFMAAVLLGGFWLFSIMNTARLEDSSRSVTAVEPDPDTRIASPPPLALPDRFADLPVVPVEPRPGSPIAMPPAPARIINAPVPAFSAPPVVFQSPPPPARVGTEEPAARPAVVFDPDLAPPRRSADGTAREGQAQDRVLAGRFANPSRTVPQGTVIPAVLETALDSTRPGGVRALVQRDVFGFDGKRVLVHRGSRLYGEYQADLAPGQKRALIRWTRLIRPDGVTIALDSPASDPLGRAGVRGKVDSKFFQRFGGAILQSVLDIGVGVATREATDGVIVALPGSTQNLQVQQQQQVQPTLKVRHGTSVSVFVARDLDFSTVDF